jgi:hypothetical protein
MAACLADGRMVVLMLMMAHWHCKDLSSLIDEGIFQNISCVIYCYAS